MICQGTMAMDYGDGQGVLAVDICTYNRALRHRIRSVHVVISLKDISVDSIHRYTQHQAIHLKLNVGMTPQPHPPTRLLLLHPEQGEGGGRPYISQHCQQCSMFSRSHGLSISSDASLRLHRESHEACYVTDVCTCHNSAGPFDKVVPTFPDNSYLSISSIYMYLCSVDSSPLHVPKA